MPSPRSSADDMASKTQLTTCSARLFVILLRRATASMSSDFVIREPSQDGSSIARGENRVNSNSAYLHSYTALGRCVRPAAKAIESLRTVWHRGGSSPRRSRAGCPENPTAQPSAARAARGPLMEPNRTENDDELLEVPDLPETPLDLNEASAFDAPPLDSPPTLGAPLGDDDALKKMGSR